MNTQEKSAANQLARRGESQALALRSAALVSRGLRDLARDSNWLIKKVFSGNTGHLAVSPTGEVCTLSALVRQGAERIAFFLFSRSQHTLTLHQTKKSAPLWCTLFVEAHGTSSLYSEGAH